MLSNHNVNAVITRDEKITSIKHFFNFFEIQEITDEQIKKVDAWVSMADQQIKTWITSPNRTFQFNFNEEFFNQFSDVINELGKNNKLRNEAEETITDIIKFFRITDKSLIITADYKVFHGISYLLNAFYNLGAHNISAELANLAVSRFLLSNNASENEELLKLANIMLVNFTQNCFDKSLKYYFYEMIVDVIPGDYSKMTRLESFIKDLEDKKIFNPFFHYGLEKLTVGLDALHKQGGNIITKIESVKNLTQKLKSLSLSESYKAGIQLLLHDFYQKQKNKNEFLEIFSFSLGNKAWNVLKENLIELTETALKQADEVHFSDRVNFFCKLIILNKTHSMQKIMAMINILALNNNFNFENIRPVGYTKEVSDLMKEFDFCLDFAKMVFFISQGKDAAQPKTAILTDSKEYSFNSKLITIRSLIDFLQTSRGIASHFTFDKKNVIDELSKLQKLIEQKVSIFRNGTQANIGQSDVRSSIVVQFFPAPTITQAPPRHPLIANILNKNSQPSQQQTVSQNLPPVSQTNVTNQGLFGQRSKRELEAAEGLSSLKKQKLG